MENLLNNLPEVINIDAYIMPLVAYIFAWLTTNIITVGLVLGLFKFLATKSHNNKDDKIISYIIGLVSKLIPSFKPANIVDLKDIEFVEKKPEAVDVPKFGEQSNNQ